MAIAPTESSISLDLNTPGRDFSNILETLQSKVNLPDLKRLMETGLLAGRNTVATLLFNGGAIINGHVSELLINGYPLTPIELQQQRPGFFLNSPVVGTLTLGELKASWEVELADNRINFADHSRTSPVDSKTPEHLIGQRPVIISPDFLRKVVLTSSGDIAFVGPKGNYYKFLTLEQSLQDLMENHLLQTAVDNSDAEILSTLAHLNEFKQLTKIIIREILVAFGCPEISAEVVQDRFWEGLVWGTNGRQT